MGDSGFEPLTSSASRKYNTLLDISGVCKTAANKRIFALSLFLVFQEIHSGCCTVAAHIVLLISRPVGIYDPLFSVPVYTLLTVEVAKDACRRRSLPHPLARCISCGY